MTTEPDTQPVADDVADQAAPLDALLVEAALGPLRRFAPDASTVRFALRLARRPRTTGRRLGGLAAASSRPTLPPGQTAKQVVGDAALGWRDEQRVRLLVENLVAAASPSKRTSSAGPEAHQRASRVLATGAAQSIGFI
jgi:polyhydroxyalkanoate synthase subunit PhaC